ncbi:hypothetical protein H6F32_10355 [Anabaena sp. FACHB-1237]|uniref:hypothetical protein n=1 Tax=Anabaena sp. FACHB-1237 TaxID=2692769 RepID=UPI0016813D08|nr:hypothetical protein [Anabaena sp. FACHB-1237]MBD2137981.1 hypothetical protein [Anabaena sp. FACHB-1237]
MAQKTLCQDCAFVITQKNTSECTHPDETEVDCAKITFCSSFTPKIKVDSPCVTYGQE